MAVNRASIVDDNFRAAIAAMTGSATRTTLDTPLKAGSGLTGRRALALL